MFNAQPTGTVISRRRDRETDREKEGLEKMNTGRSTCKTLNTPATCKVYIKARFALTITCAATLRNKLQMKLATKSGQEMDTRPTSPNTDPITPDTWQSV